jgi:hypothetical protein
MRSRGTGLRLRLSSIVPRTNRTSAQMSSEPYRDVASPNATIATVAAATTATPPK